MIPILYEASEKNFTTNGLGRLTDAISCIVEEERNGSYELELEYPIDGAHFSDLANERIILAQPSLNTTHQPFRIYKMTKKSSGAVIVYATHVSYQLRKVVVMPFDAVSASSAMAGVGSHVMGENPFTFTTDKVTDAQFKLEDPTAIRSVLGGIDGSILDVYGGEYEFDRWTVKLQNERGSNRGVSLRYGKNIRSLESEVDTDGVYTGVLPFWKSTSEESVELVYPEAPVYNEEHKGDYTHGMIIPLDLSSDYEEKPTVEQLVNAAKSYLTSNSPWKPNENLTVDFVQLADTEEYKDYAPLQRVNLCDTVSIYHEPLGITTTAKVIRTRWNVLLDSYDEVEVGDPSSSFSSTISEKLAELEEISTSWTEEAVKNATNLITGGLGGYVVIRRNANGKPEEILIMDSPDREEAVNVIRMNKNGIGFSTNGYEGPFANAWTIDGNLVADYITSGTMSANRIRGGTLTAGGSGNGNGVVRVYNASGEEVCSMTNEGLRVTKADINVVTDNYSDSIIAISNTTGGYKYTNTISSWAIETKHEFEKRSSWITPYGYGHENTTSQYGHSTGHYDANIEIDGYANIKGSLSVGKSKNRYVKTDNYGTVLQYCYEMASPMFGDIGSARLDASGKCYLYFDEIFKETVNTGCEYYVFLQKRSSSDIWVSEKSYDYCLIEGAPNTIFDWEIKVKQTGDGMEYMRLDPYNPEDPSGRKDIDALFVDYETLADIYLNELEESYIDD